MGRRLTGLCGPALPVHGWEYSQPITQTDTKQKTGKVLNVNNAPRMSRKELEQELSLSTMPHGYLGQTTETRTLHVNDAQGHLEHLNIAPKISRKHY